MTTTRTVLVLLLALLAGSRGAAGAPVTPYHWEKIHLLHASPSQVFARLGLTHITRYGYTRDGMLKTDLDRTFPPGLTDVVPYDTTGLLLVRGTEQGMALFRQRVAAADVVAPQWQVRVDVWQQVSGETLVATRTLETARLDAPLTLALDENGRRHHYRLRVHLNPDNALAVTWQCGQALLSPAASPPVPGQPAPAVLVPALVWAAPVSQIIRPGGTTVFGDRAQDRQAARLRLGLADGTADSPEGFPDDFAVRVTLSLGAPAPLSTPSVPPSVAPALPGPPAPGAAPAAAPPPARR